MTVSEPAARAGLVARVRGMLLHPSAEWDVIDREPATIGGLFTGYACILALISPIAILIRGAAFDHWGATFMIIEALGTYVLSLLGAFVVGLIIEALAPTFEGQKSRAQAMKLSVYAYTAAWVGGVFNIVPVLGGLIAIAAGFYSLYTLYQGLPRLMHSPAQKTTGYFALTLVAAIVVNILIAWVLVLITAPFLITSAALGAAFGR